LGRGIEVLARERASTVTSINVVVPYWNCGSWIARALDSIATQTRRPDRVVVADDGSTDLSAATGRHRCAGPRWFGHDWRYRRNETNVGKALNLKLAIASMELGPEDVVVIVDGDDYLKPQAIERIERIYRQDPVWLTYGQYEVWPERTEQVLASLYPDHVLANRSFRTCEIHFNHPITFRHKLWAALEDRDFQDDAGQWFRGGADFILIVPMMEMAGAEHILFNEEPIYVYNAINPLADNLTQEPGRQGTIVRRPMKARLGG
jgi:glycosyltransferase involved in cell wall biosynthesis